MSNVINYIGSYINALDNYIFGNMDVITFTTTFTEIMMFLFVKNVFGLFI